MNLDALTTAEWDLDALCEQAATLLAVTGAGSADARVREQPDARTVRYYQSLGLLDRPVRYEGRRALYGFRHLLQMLCVKLLQARGLSLAQVQQALAAASTAQLRSAVAEALSAPSAPRPTPVAPAPAPAAVPAPVPASPWLTVELAPGLLVSLDRRHHPAPEALIERLRHAVDDANASPPVSTSSPASLNRNAPQPSGESR